MRPLVWAVRLGRPLIQAYHRLRRGMTLGVRAIVTDDEGRVLLVEHTYVKGWWLPGGGVERGETLHQALERELMEEAGVRLTAAATLLSVHTNRTEFKGDQVALWRVEAWEACAATSQGEIAKLDWFAPDALPEGTTRATRARVAEALGAAAADGWW